MGGSPAHLSHAVLDEGAVARHAGGATAKRGGKDGGEPGCFIAA